MLFFPFNWILKRLTFKLSSVRDNAFIAPFFPFLYKAVDLVTAVSCDKLVSPLTSPRHSVSFFWRAWKQNGGRQDKWRQFLFTCACYCATAATAATTFLLYVHPESRYYPF